MTLWTLGLLACVAGGEKEETTGETGDLGSSTTTASTSTTSTVGTTNTDATTVDPSLEDQLYGVIPGFELSAPMFAATNMDGTSRGRPDLIGHPTVVWFYPLAETPG
jgi:hypothetical protein